MPHCGDGATDDAGFLGCNAYIFNAVNDRSRLDAVASRPNGP